MSASLADTYDLVLSVFKRLEIALFRSDVGGRNIVAYASPVSRRRPQLSINRIPVQVVVLKSIFKSDLPQDINMFPKKHVAEYVRRLAETYRVTYKRTR